MSDQPAGRANAAGASREEARDGQPRLASLEGFVPIDRRGSDAPMIPTRANGAVLKVDLTGFTRLTIALNEAHGPKAGAERLGSFLNDMFATIIGFVHRHGGTVIQFTGDGMTCWFPGDQGAVPAVASALAGQRAFRNPRDVDIAVGLKMAVAAGHADRLALGDPNIQKLDILAGPPLARAEAGERLAKSGEVVIDWTSAGLLASRFPLEVRVDRLEHRHAPDGEALPFLVVPPDLDCGDPPADGPPTGDDTADYTQWVPEFVRTRIADGGGEMFLAEYRFVTALFVRFGGIDYASDSRALDRLDAYIRWSQSIIAQYGGTLCQVIIGDKGTYFYASFGAPQSHEDDSVRAVRAAEHLSHPPADLSYMDVFQAGVAQGPMLCGLIGSDRRRTYGVLGESANAAARLMQRADPGQVLVEAAVADATEGHFGFGGTVLHVGPLVAVALKPGPPTTTHAAYDGGSIVGRDGPISAFESWLSAVNHRLLVYAGEPGIGKTRLISELSNRAAAQGKRPVRGSGTALDAKVPFGVWRSIVAQLLGLVSGTYDEVHQRLTQMLGTSAAAEEMMALLRPVLTVAERGTGPVTEASDEDSADAVLDAALELIEAVTDENVILFLDNAQWFDSSSIRLIRQIRDRHLHLSIVMATRSRLESGFHPGQQAQRTGDSEQFDVLPPRVRSLIRPGDVVEALQPLGSEDILALVAGELAVGSVPADLADLVIRRSEGNPFFAIELIQSFGQSGDIEVENGSIRLFRSIAELGHSVPVAVKARLDARLSDLPIEQQSTLKVASVLSHTFDVEMLASVHPGGIPAAEVEAQLDSLRGLGIVRLVDHSVEPRFTFAHDLVREAALGLQTEEITRRIHARAAHWIEDHALDLPGRDRILAEHWDQAGQIRPAIDAYVDSAENALASAAYEEAVEALTRAIELANTPGESSVTRFELADWYVRRGRARVLEQAEGERDAKDDMDTALELIGLDRPRWAPTAASVMAEYVRHRRGVRMATGASATEAALGASAYEQLVELSFLEANEMAGAYAVMRSLTLAERSGDDALASRALAGVGFVFGLLGSHQRAEFYVDTAEERASGAADRSALVYVSIVRSLYYTGVGAWDRAEHSARLALEIADQQHHRRRYEDALSHIMMQAYLRGRYAATLEHAEELAELAGRRGAKRNMAYALQGKIYAQLETNSLDAASAALDELAALGYGRIDPGGADPDRPVRPDDEALDSEAIGMRGLVLLRSGRIDEARTAAELLITRLGHTRPSNFSAILAYLAPLEIIAVAMQAGSRPGLESMRDRALRLARRYVKVFPVGEPRALYWEAVLAEPAGKQTTRRLLNDSVGAAARLGMPGEEATALRLITQVAQGDELARAEARLAHLHEVMEEGRPA